jgi:hypothetical protein
MPTSKYSLDPRTSLNPQSNLLKGIKGGGREQFSREEVYFFRLGDPVEDLSRRRKGSLDGVKRHLSLNRMRRLLERMVFREPLVQAEEKSRSFSRAPW